jgi:glyoxylase-like metal-dependent hydrolase (beta-lactamase superfamily II)
MIKLDRISDSVWDYCTPIYEGHITIIKLKDRLVFIDSGREPVTAKKVRSEAEKMLNLPAKHLILTHQHWDHVFGNQAFEDCEIISSKASYDDMKSYLKTYWKEENIEKMRKEQPEIFSDFKIVFPTKTFEDEFQIEDENITIKICQGDGHSIGSCYIFVPEEKILITGDLLFSGVTPFFGDPNADIFKWTEVYYKMIELNPEKIIPGHGKITDKNEILNQIKYYKYCISWMRKFIEEGNSRTDLEKKDDFPLIQSMNIEGFEELVKSSKRRLYDVIKDED